MVKHIVLFKLKEHAEGASRTENAQLLKERIEGLRGRIPGLLSLEVGVGFPGNEETYDLALVATLESREALAAYQEHPLHKAVCEQIRPRRLSRAVVDYEVCKE